MQFHNRKIVILIVFGVLLIAVSVFAYAMGRTHAKRNFYSSQIGQGVPVRLGGGIIDTLGSEHIFYSTYCGSSCLGFTVINLSTGKTQRGSLSFMADDNGNAYTLFEDWSGEVHRFDGEFVSVRGREHSEKHILDFTIKDEKTNLPTINSVEF